MQAGYRVLHSDATQTANNAVLSDDAQQRMTDVLQVGATELGIDAADVDHVLIASGDELRDLLLDVNRVAKGLPLNETISALRQQAEYGDGVMFLHRVWP